MNVEYKNTDHKNYQEFLMGDIAGFEALVIDYKDNLINFIKRYCKDIHLAEDIAQDVFVEVYIHPERYNFKNSFKTYLFTIARNKAVDYFRKNNKEFVFDELLEWASDDKIVEDKVIKNEEKMMIHTAMKSLKQDYQVVIILADFEELSYKEVAKVMNKSLPQTKVLLHRARKALGKVLEKGGYIHEK